MKCPKCGFENPNDSRFCMSCGFDLFPEGSVVSVQNVPSSQAAAKSGGSSSKYLIIGLIAVVIILGIALFAVLGNANKSKDQPASEPQQEVQEETESGAGTPDATVAEAGETDLNVTDSGYSLISDEYSDKPAFYYGLEYKNTSDKLAIGTIDIRITCRDKDGGVIDTYDGYSDTCLEPGEVGCFAQSCGEISEKPADVTIDFTFTPAEADGYPSPEEIDKVEVTGTKIKKDDTFSVIVGDVENKSKKGITYARVYVLFRDSKGKITGGEEVYVDKLREGKNAFSYDLLSTSLVTDDYTCYGVGRTD